MRRVHALAGSPPPRGLEPGFATILRIIVDQQVSTQSGAAIWRKLEETLGPISPPVILKADEEGLRGCGFSGPKARYGMALATAVTDGTLDLDKLLRMSNARVEETLVQVKGIGRWTAEIYLMFALGRTDIWPAGDLAVAEAAGQLLGLPTRPTIPEMDEIGELMSIEKYLTSKNHCAHPINGLSWKLRPSPPQRQLVPLHGRNIL